MAQTSQPHNETAENQSTSSKNKCIVQGGLSNDPRKPSNQQASDTRLNPGDSMNKNEIDSVSNHEKVTSRYQPSKSFLLKCQTEIETLLDNIKSCYHDDIKGLLTDKLYTDYILILGEEFERSVHRCIFFSRAFKFYNSLRTFELLDTHQEKDIVISEFQPESSLNQTEDKSAEQSIDQIDALNLYCSLPEKIIQPEQLSSFLHRIYLNIDVSEEETDLNQTIFNWLRVNRPEILKPNKKFCPNHKESFRTIQPDFEKLYISDSSALSVDMSEDLLSSVASAASSDQRNESQTITESTTGISPGLTRTETFEKIPKLEQNLGRKGVQASAETSGSFSPDSTLDKSTDLEPYAPTTRTGLRPKTFTTPVDVCDCVSPNLAKSPAKNICNESFISEQDCTESSNNERFTTPNLANKPAPAKRSSITPKTTTDIKQGSTKIKASSQASSHGKAEKITNITRAQPISMERSQSPGTKVIKGSGRNFIAANKRLVSQMEKKVSIQNELLNMKDNETDSVNEISLVLETYGIDDVIANMDKFALNSQSKLADALSRMFIDKLLVDTIILVAGHKQIDAHRCILAARSAYLSEAISKLSSASSDGSPSSAKQKLTIELTDFSYSSVYFSMLHIYSGAVKVPDDVDLEELVKLTNLLHVTTLRQVCMQTLRINYCHFFHKPCKICCLGVLKTLPLVWRYDYNDLYQKCLQWIGSNFTSIFCLKEFSDMKPNDLIEECYSATMNQLAPDNVIPKTIECQKLLKNLPHVKWTESVICLVGRLLEDFCHYVAENYEKILVSDSFMNLKKNCWECEVLEENLLAAMNHLKPDSGCKTLIQLNKIECAADLTSEESHVSDSFSNLIVKMRKYCERYLLKDAAAVVHCNSWKLMSPTLKKKIKDQAILSTDFDEPNKLLVAKPKLTSRVASQSTNKTSANSGSDGAKSPGSRLTPDLKLKSPNATLLPQPKNKTPASRHVKILK